MDIDELKSVAKAIIEKHKGILAADESNPTIKTMGYRLMLLTRKPTWSSS